MWFSFGFVTLICFAVFMAFRRIDARWRGTSASENGVAFDYKIETYKDTPQGLRIGVPAPEGFDFALKPETAIDGFFKRIGISDEQQLADPEFDRSIYIVSDDTTFCQGLANARTLHTQTLHLFDAKPGTPRLEGIRCHHGRIWVRYKVDEDFKAEQVNAVAAHAVPVLQRLSALLETLPKRAGRWRDPFVLKAMLILALSSALAINGTAQLFRLYYWSDLPSTLDSVALLKPALIAGLSVIALLAAVTLVLLGRSSRTHLVLLDLLVSGTFGACATAYAEVRDLNIDMDRSEARVVETTVSNARIARRRRACFIQVQAYGDSEIRLPSDACRRLHWRDRVTLYVRDGYLGVPWVEQVGGSNGLLFQ
jgi:hypothetical protein